jgi:hypothetical protein
VLLIYAHSKIKYKKRMENYRVERRLRTTKRIAERIISFDLKEVKKAARVGQAPSCFLVCQPRSSEAVSQKHDCIASYVSTTEERHCLVVLLLPSHRSSS